MIKEIYLIIEKETTADYDVCFAFKNLEDAVKKREELEMKNPCFNYTILCMDLD